MRTLQGHELRVPIDEQALREICVRWHVSTLEVFGSVLRDDFDPDRSDVDLMVEFLPEARISSWDRLHLQDEFEGLLGRKVDLLRRRAVEDDENPYRRRGILDSVESLYVAS